MKEPNEKDVKYRHENKYLVTEAGFKLIENRIKGLMRLDEHTGDSGEYNIRSIYFDDYMNSCYYENENGTDPREKFRIRIYNRNSDNILLELKRKEKGKCLKLSCRLSKAQLERLMVGKYVPISEENPPLLNKLSMKMMTRGFKPKIITEYDREPWVYDEGNVRVTFDRNIRSSKEIGRFFDENLPVREVMPTGQHILEVKWDEFLPRFIYKAVMLKDLPQTAYSKYSLCRKYCV